MVLCFIFQMVEDGGLGSGLSLLFCAASSGAAWFVSAMAGELIQQRWECRASAHSSVDEEAVLTVV